MLGPHKLTVQRKLTVGFTAVATLVVAAAATALWTISALDSSAGRIASLAETNGAALALNADIAQMHSLHLGYVGTVSFGSDATAARRLLTAQQTKVSASLAYAQASADGDDELMNHFSEIADKLDAYRRLTRTTNVAAPTGEAANWDASLAQADVIYADASELAGTIAARASAEAEEELALAGRTARQSRSLMVLAATSVFFGTLLVGRISTRSVIGPLGRLRDAMDSIASGNGDLSRRVDDSAGDEIAAVGRAFNRFMGTMQQSVKAVADHASKLQERSAQLTVVSRDMAAAAAATEQQALSVSAAAEQMALTVQTVSRGADEVSESIGEVAGSAASAAQIAASAAATTATTGDLMGRLGKASEAIHGVLEVISSISEQTRILALNARVEAARAGEAGLGFAVVAGEVKTLAQRTSDATQDITHRIEEIQSDVVRAMGAMEHMRVTVDGINEAQASIAAAVGQQTAATGDIGRSVSELAAGADSIAQTISMVADVAQQTTGGASSALAAAADLADMSRELEALVKQFRY